MDRQSSARWFGALGGGGLPPDLGAEKSAHHRLRHTKSFPRLALFWTATAVSCITPNTLRGERAGEFLSAALLQY